MVFSVFKGNQGVLKELREERKRALDNITIPDV